MKGKVEKVLLIGIVIFCFALLSSVGAQQKVGGGDIKYEAAGSAGPVVFSHERHVNQQKVKCTDCHTKIFKMKKGEFKMAQADHGQEKYCGTCHNGKKSFTQSTEVDCAKCHKK